LSSVKASSDRQFIPVNKTQPSKRKLKLLDSAGDYTSPQLMIEILDDAMREIDYSNFHTNRMRLIQGIIRDWAKDNGIEMGPTKAQRDKMREEASRQRNIQAYVDMNVPKDRAEAFVDGKISARELLEEVTKGTEGT